MSRNYHRYKLLLDEGLPLPQYFPLLNNFFNVKHVLQDFKGAGMSDEEIYALAAKENRLIITFNKKHFQPMARKSKETGVIAISHSPLPPQQNTKLTALLRRKTPGELFGRFHSITGETDIKDISSEK